MLLHVCMDRSWEMVLEDTTEKDEEVTFIDFKPKVLLIAE